ncbi:hypothetical protein WJX77_010077 [Trebouxia sp. C0004]
MVAGPRHLFSRSKCKLTSAAVAEAKNLALKQAFRELEDSYSRNDSSLRFTPWTCPLTASLGADLASNRTSWCTLCELGNRRPHNVSQAAMVFSEHLGHLDSLCQDFAEKHRMSMDKSADIQVSMPNGQMRRKGQKRTTLHCEKPAKTLSKPKRPSASLILSAMQARKAVRKAANAMFLLVTKTDEGVHVAAVTKHDTSGNQQSHADSTPVPQSELQSILHEYKDCFPEVLPDGLPPERDVAHTTPTESEGLRRGIIEPSSLPFGAAVLLTVRKRDGSLRMCVDYRAFNKMTINKRVSSNQDEG